MTLLDGCNGNADQGVAREFQRRGLLVQSVFYVIPIGYPRPLPVRSLIVGFLIVGLAGNRQHLALVHADLHELTGIFIGSPGIEAEGRDLRELKRLLVGKRDGAGRPRSARIRNDVFVDRTITLLLDRVYS